MNVGVVASRFQPESGGGYTFENEILDKIQDLAGESHHRFTVIGAFRDHKRQVSREANSVQFIDYPKPDLAERARAKLGRKISINDSRWQHATTLERLAKKAGVEFVWFVGPSPVQIDLPYLAIVWDLQHRLQPWFPEVLESRVWNRRETELACFLRRASFIIAGTEEGKREIEAFYQIPAERIRILSHPTPAFALDAPAETGMTVRKDYSLPADYLLYPAQFWPHKNHANLLYAVQMLKNNHNLSIPVVFVGSDKGNMEYCRTLAASLGLSGQIFFLGFISKDDLVGLYRNALALAYVSYFGPENLPPLEAFALGCPVIAANVAGVQEQLGESAVLVDPSNPEQIAEAIKLVYDNPALRIELVNRGRTRASKWIGSDFVRGVFSILDDFDAIRRCWGS